MKNLIFIFIIALFSFSCSSQQYISKSYIDDIYYNPKTKIVIPLELYLGINYHINPYYNFHYEYKCKFRWSFKRYNSKNTLSLFR